MSTPTSFRQRLQTLVAVSLLAVLAFSVATVWMTRDQITSGRKAVLVATVESAHSLVMSFHDQAKAGRMSDEQARAAAVAALRGIRYGNGDYVYVWSLEGVGVMHPIKPEWEGQMMIGKVKDGTGGDVIGALSAGMKASRDGTAFVETHFPRPGHTEPVAKLQFLKQVPDWNWMVGSGLYMDDVSAAVRTTTLQVGALAAAILLGIGAVCLWTYRGVLHQLGGEPALAAQVMSQVAQGQLDIAIPTAPAGSLMDDLRLMVQSLRGTVSQVRETSDSVNLAAGEIANGNADLGARTEQTAASLQRTASAMEQLVSTVRHTAESAGNANALAASAAAEAQRGGAAVTAVEHTMGEINQSSARMADIIGTIDGIAFQTNILALNAAVEAARAGEQGRGFAVVASEVRTLAQRSADAAKEIRQLITASIDKVTSGARQVGDAERTMRDIVDSVQRVSAIVSEISVASAQQSQGLCDVSGAVSQLEEMTQRNAALVEQSAAAAHSLHEQSHRLSAAISSFQVDRSLAPA
ncbi:methyl-accepting chemotaxis protein [Leptothrix cholodnii]|uniref:methyl-accepting chemotaxis protein n=1 Tax=Leptothrix cholodnii TaxID=34029 RepID=UPI0003121314|nr:methyl-accepting chemotaxis protein [Leptothrix cholodnii]